MFSLKLGFSKRYAKPAQSQCCCHSKADIEASCEIVITKSAPALLPPPPPPPPPTQETIHHYYIVPSNHPFLPHEYYIAKMVQGHHGVGTWAQKPEYATYKSPYGPNYKIGRNFHGISVGRAMKFGITAGSFGAVGGIFALMFFSEVPKVRTDIMQKIPVLGEYFERELPPEDNPF